MFSGFKMPATSYSKYTEAPKKQEGKKSVLVAYFLWFIGSLCCAHLLYLRRDRQVSNVILVILSNFTCKSFDVIITSSIDKI